MTIEYSNTLAAATVHGHRNKGTSGGGGGSSSSSRDEGGRHTGSQTGRHAKGNEHTDGRTDKRVGEQAHFCVEIFVPFLYR